jgi:hypothetical protein
MIIINYNHSVYKMDKIKKYTVFGERCSGTNYLCTLLELNFEVELTWELSRKHFFGFEENLREKAENILIIGITREITSWINSFFREKHHIPLLYKNLPLDESIYEFLHNEFFSIDDNMHGYKTWKNELMTDRNIYTGERYKNIFELRHVKNKFLIEDMPNKTKNYILIRYEDLLENFEKTMYLLKDMGLKVRDTNHFPVNTTLYKNTKTEFRPNSKKEFISKEMILNNPNMNPYYELKLGYI